MQSLDKPDYFFNLSVWSAPPVTYENKGAGKTGELTFNVPSSVSYIYADCAAYSGGETTINGDLILNLADSKTFGQVVTIHFLNGGTNNEVIVNFTGYSSSLNQINFGLATYAPGIVSLVWLGDHWAITTKTILEPTVE